MSISFPALPAAVAGKQNQQSEDSCERKRFRGPIRLQKQLTRKKTCTFLVNTPKNNMHTDDQDEKDNSSSSFMSILDRVRRRRPKKELSDPSTPLGQTTILPQVGNKISKFGLM